MASDPDMPTDRYTALTGLDKYAVQAQQRTAEAAQAAARPHYQAAWAVQVTSNVCALALFIAAIHYAVKSYWWLAGMLVGLDLAIYELGLWRSAKHVLRARETAQAVLDS